MQFNYIKRLKNYWFEFIIFSLFLFYLIWVRIVIPIIFTIQPPLPNTWHDWDFYIHMSNDITSIFRGEVIAPFCYRPLVPFLAGLLPFDLWFSFLLINIISIFLTGIMLYFTLRLYFNKYISSTGLIFFILLNHLTPTIPSFQGNYFFHALFYLNYMVDSVAFLFIMCCFYCILKKKDKSYCIFLTIGILVKEVILFTIVVYLIYNYLDQNENFKFRKRIKNLGKKVKYIGPAIIIFISLRLIIFPPSINNYLYWSDLYNGNEYFTIGMILEFAKVTYEQFFYGNGFYDYSIGIWGITSIFFIVEFVFFCYSVLRELYFRRKGILIPYRTLNKFNENNRFLNWVKLYGIFMVLVYLQLFIGFGRTKPIYYGFFPMILIAVSGLNRLFKIKPIIDE